MLKEVEELEISISILLIVCYNMNIIAKVNPQKNSCVIYCRGNKYEY